jgi:hypothetical protein
MSWHIYAVGGKEAALRLARDAVHPGEKSHPSRDTMEWNECASFILARHMLITLIETIPDSMSNFVLVKAQASGFGKQIGSFSVSHDIYPIR